MKVLIAGNLLGLRGGRVTTQGMILAGRLSSGDFQVARASSYENKLVRLFDIIFTILMNGRSSDVMIIEVYSGPAFVIAEVSSYLGKIFRLPMILVLHGGNLPSFAARFPRRLRRVFERSAALVAPSTYLAEQMSGAGFEISVIPNLIDLKEYPFRLRTNLAPRLLWMRSFHEIYNPMMAIETLVKVRERYPNATLVMAGPDKGLEAEVKIAARDLGVKDAVRFPGFLDSRAKTEEFARADIFINTNRIDNMPVSVVEACASGLPVVATDVGGIRHLIADGKTGILVDDNDAEQMAAAVIKLIEEPDLAGRLSENGRQLADLSDWNAVRHEWGALFDRLVREPRGADGRPDPAAGVGR